MNKINSLTQTEVVYDHPIRCMWCYKCNEWKPFSEFYNNKTKPNGKQRECKHCMELYNIEHSKQRIKYGQEYRQDHPKYWQEYNKKYIQEHSEQIKEYNKKYYMEHIEEKKEYDKQYYKDHINDIKEYSKKYNQENRDRLSVKEKAYRQTTKGKLVHINSNNRRRMQVKATPTEYHITEYQWNNILNSQNNICAECGAKFTETNQPTIDHIVPLSKGGMHSSNNIQALCKHCNCTKNSSLDYNKIQTWLIN